MKCLKKVIPPDYRKPKQKSIKKRPACHMTHFGEYKLNRL